MLAWLQTWRALIFSRVCLSVCLSVCVTLTGTSTLQRKPFWRILVTRTLLWSSLAATIMVQIGRRGTARRLFENFKKSKKNHRIRISKFWSIIFFASVSPVYCEKIWLDSNKTDGGDTFWSLPFQQPSYRAAAALAAWRRRAATVDDRCADPEMLHPHHSADPNWGHSELGAQLGRKNQPACFFVCKNLPAYTGAKIIKIKRVFPELWS